MLLSLIVLLINRFTYNFPGNNYFPENISLFLLIILLINCGLILFFGKNSTASRSGIELLYFFLVMGIIALATNAVQLTPFTPIDTYILQFESLVGVNMDAILRWTDGHPQFKKILGVTYDTLPYQMSILPLIVMAVGRFDLLWEYYFLLLITALIGFGFYYFFPTTAPASVIPNSLFSIEQMATGLKFNQIHHYLPPVTLDGGLIALPSFHTIWALMCVYLLRPWLIPCLMLLVMNTILILSCVLLGWHYPLDIAAALVLLAFSYYLLTIAKKLSIDFEI